MLAGAAVVAVEFIGVAAERDAPGVLASAGVLHDEIIGAVTVEVADADHRDAGQSVAQLDRPVTGDGCVRVECHAG